MVLVVLYTVRIGEINTTQAVMQTFKKALIPEISTIKMKAGEKCVFKGSMSWGIRR